MGSSSMAAFLSSRSNICIGVFLLGFVSSHATPVADQPKYVMVRASAPRYRPGEATETNSCQFVRGVPDELREPQAMKPEPLDTFYQKYTEAYGIPILSSEKVPDDALRRFCYEVRFMLAGNSKVRSMVYNWYGHYAVLGVDEIAVDIPEFRHLSKDKFGTNRGLGAIQSNPTTMAGGDNALCDLDDTRLPEDIVLHEISHSVDNIGASLNVGGWKSRLTAAYNDAMAKGLWEDTYSTSSVAEYFANAAQMYFNVKRYSDSPGGTFGPITSRDRLRTYDPVLYELVWEVFPCNNPYIERCQGTREAEDEQRLMMNCDVGGHKQTYCRARKASGWCDSKSGYMEENCPGHCNKDQAETANKHSSCRYWAGRGFCEGTYSDYMAMNCPESCANLYLKDDRQDCEYWAAMGECTKNPMYMMVKCPQSCQEKLESVFADEHPMCPRWAERGECLTNKPYMMKRCKLACYTRLIDGDLEDQQSKCRNYDLQYMCDKYATQMKTDCENSCMEKLYSPLSNTINECKKRAQNGECSNFQMIVDCPTFCYTPADPSLSDSGSDCTDLKARGECQTADGYATVYCPKTCGVSGGRG